MRSGFMIALVLCAVAAVAAQTNPMRPGRWETTMQMEMPNMPMKMPEMKVSECVTAEELTRDPASGLPRGAQNADDKSCKMSDYKVSGNTVTWKMTCAGQAAMSGDGQLTFAGDSYTGTMKMAGAQGSMSMKMSGKRVGDCTE